MINQEIINQGRAAAELLSSETFKLVIQSLRIEAFKAWAGSLADDKEGREEMYYFQLALSKIEARLLGMQDSAKVEALKQD